MSDEAELPTMKPAVKRLFEVLSGRSGFNWWWDGIDTHIQAEIIEEMNATTEAGASDERLK
jgi:hypothetical protein